MSNEQNQSENVTVNPSNEQEITDQAPKREHRVYLSLPPVKSAKAFNNMISNLKEGGAKFDSYNKAWYITPDMDFNQFKGFLGLPYEIVNEKGKELRAKEAEKKGEEKSKDRESIKDKLDKNKETVEKNTPEKKEPEHNREEAR